MKTKISVLILILAAFSTSAMAQINFGAKAGVNINKIDGKSFSEEFRYGYHIGGLVEIKLGKKLGLQPEVLFNHFQTKTDTSFAAVYSTDNISNFRDVKLNYLTIPILATYKLANILSLQAGPQVGILLSQNQDLVSNGKEAFKSGEFSMVGGAQLNIKNFRASGRYVIGLNNISDLDNQNQWKSQGFQLSVGFVF